MYVGNENEQNDWQGSGWQEYGEYAWQPPPEPHASQAEPPPEPHVSTEPHAEPQASQAEPPAPEPHEEPSGEILLERVAEDENTHEAWSDFEPPEPQANFGCNISESAVSRMGNYVP